MCFPVNQNNPDLLGANPQKNPVEDVQTRFCKRLLGVRDKTTNWGVTSELGRFPTVLTIIDRMIKFWYHMTQTSSPILKAALQTSVNLDASGKRVWFTFLRRCMKHMGIDHIIYTSDVREISQQVNKAKQNLKRIALNDWSTAHDHLKTNDSSKLMLFSHIKNNHGYEDYLSSCTNQKSRVALSKIRISSHNLPVEVGRYMGMDRHDRLCPFCSTGLGDEQHYLCECLDPLFSTHRDPLFTHITKKFPNFPQLSPKDKTTFLLGHKDHLIISKVGKFCHQVMEIFQEFNTKTV